MPHDEWTYLSNGIEYCRNSLGWFWRDVGGGVGEIIGPYDDAYKLCTSISEYEREKVKNLTLIEVAKIKAYQETPRDTLKRWAANK